MSSQIHTSSDDVIVSISQSTEMYELLGTRAALEAEGFIPSDFEWPHGFKSEYWEVGGLLYRLGRKRPNGAKGPRRDFLEVDWWSVVCSKSRPASGAERELARIEAELKRARYRASEAGTREWMTFYERYQATKKDDAYQAFIGKVLDKGQRLFCLAPRFDLGGAAS